MSAFRITTFLFIITTVLIVLIRPSFFFDKEGNLKSFSINYGDKHTPVPFYVFIYLAMIMFYGLAIFIENKINILIQATKGS